MNEKIHSIMNEYMRGYIPFQEITHAANAICAEPTEEKVNEMTTYLMQFDKEFVALQTVNTKSLTNNQVRFGMSEVRKLIQQTATENTQEEG